MITAGKAEIALVKGVLEPEMAIEFGKVGISLYDEYLTQTGDSFFKGGGLHLRPGGGTPALSAFSHGIYTSPADQRLVNGAQNKFMQIIYGELGITGAEIGVASLFVGAAADGSWHQDPTGWFRMLVNLSEKPIGLDVATVWDKDAHMDARLGFRRPNPPPPEEFVSYMYQPGDGLIFNNDPTEPRDMIPHRGWVQPGKVFLRLDVLAPRSY